MAAPDFVEFVVVSGLDMVGMTVDTIDDNIEPAIQFVRGEPLGKHPPYHRLGDLLAMGDIRTGATLLRDAMVGECLVHGLDDIVARAEIAQDALRIVGNRPASGFGLRGEAVLL